MKKLLALLLVLVMALSLCEEQPVETAEPVEYTLRCPSLTESLTAIGEKYMQENPNVTISFNFDSSGSCSPRSRKVLCAICSFPPLPSR